MFFAKGIEDTKGDAEVMLEESGNSDLLSQQPNSVNSVKPFLCLFMPSHAEARRRQVDEIYL